MITLFRRIRQHLINSGSLSKYLLYALGEITLVVIGILIALQVNNWNENRKTAAEEQTILSQLLEDLEFAKIQSGEYIEREKEDIGRLLMLLGDEEAQQQIDEIPNPDRFFYEALWNVSHDTPVIISYEDLKNSGNSGKITNPTLRTRLSVMELINQALAKMIDDRLSVHQIRIDNIVEQDANYLPMVAARRNLDNLDIGNPNDYTLLLQDQEVKNLLGMKLDLTYEVLGVRENLDRILTQVIELVESEIRE